MRMIDLICYERANNPEKGDPEGEGSMQMREPPDCPSKLGKGPEEQPAGVYGDSNTGGPPLGGQRHCGRRGRYHPFTAAKEVSVKEPAGRIESERKPAVSRPVGLRQRRARIPIRKESVGFADKLIYLKKVGFSIWERSEPFQ